MKINGERHPKRSHMRRFDITWAVQGPVGYVGYIYLGSYTHGVFWFEDHVEWGSNVYRFGDLHTYHNMPSESPATRSHSGKATLLAVPA